MKAGTCKRVKFSRTACICKGKNGKVRFRKCKKKRR